MENEDLFEDSGSEWQAGNDDISSSSSSSISFPPQHFRKNQNNVECAKRDLFDATVSADSNEEGNLEIMDTIALVHGDQHVFEDIFTDGTGEEASSSHHDAETVSHQLVDTEQTGQEHKANILIENSTAILTVTKSLHYGQYTVLFDELDKPQKDVDDNDDNCANILNRQFVSFIIADQNTSEHHLCKFDDKNTPCYISIPNGKILNVNVRWCLSPGQLSGELVLTGNHVIGALLYRKINAEDVVKKSELKTKSHCCLFCSKFVTALPRHLLATHRDRDEVKNVYKLPLNSLERSRLLKDLRIRGDNLYNSKCCTKDRIPIRTSKKVAVENMVPCPNCKSLFVSKSLYKHHQNCVNRPKNKPQILKEARRLALSSYSVVSSPMASTSSNDSCVNVVQPSNLETDLLRMLLEPLKNDEVGQIIRSDKTLLILAQRYAIKHRACPHNYRNCRQELRLAARLFIELHKLDNNIKCVQDYLDTTYYLKIMNAVNVICSGDAYSFKIPTIVQSIRLVILNLVNALISYYRIQGLLPTDPILVRLLDFKNFHSSEFLIRLGKTAYISSQKKRMFKNKDLPAITDIAKLTNYLQSEAEKCFQILLEKYNYNAWVRLGTIVLHEVVLFNRRRPGEVSRMLLQSYQERRSIQKEDHENMTRMEVLLAERFSMIKLIGKRGRVLSALLTKAQAQYLDMFTSLRTMSGIPKNNEFLFCSKNSIGHLEAGGRAMATFAKECNADNPELLRCTRLRKQVATISQFLVLNENEIQQLADFMGHDINVHRQNYRQPELQRHITVLSRFFMAAGGNLDITKFKGKSMTELEILIENETINEEETDEEVEDMVDVFLGESCRESLPQTSTGTNETSFNSQQIPCVILEKLESSLETMTRVPMKRSPIKTRSSKLRKPRRNIGSCSFEESVKTKTPIKRKQSTIHEIIHELRSPIRTRKNKSKRKYTRREIELLTTTFKKKIKSHIMPSKKEFEDLIEKYHSEFFDRTAQHLYSFMQYRYKLIRGNDKFT